VRVLAIDYGTARFGLAVSDALGVAAHMLPPIEVRGLDAEEAAARVVEVAREKEAGRIVLGLPLNMDGTAGPAAKRVRKFGRLLAEASGLDVDFEDERLSTAEAEGLLAGRELTRLERRRRVDSLSAQIILTGWLARRGREGDGGAGSDERAT